MSRKTQLIIGAITAVIGIAVLIVARVNFGRMVTTATIVTPAVDIAAGALITPNMLEEREVPRPLLDEDIYVRSSELAGQVAVVHLSPGMVVYKPFAVSQAEFRLTDDPTLTVVSFPVDPSRAIGGQLQPGHHVDIWRLVGVRPSNAITLTEMAATDWSTATLLVEAATVVDVRAQSGQAVARSPQALPGYVEGDGQRRSSSGSLQIVTVAVDPSVAQDILTLVAEEQAGAELWVSLSPLVPQPAKASTQTGGSSDGLSRATTPGKPVGESHTEAPAGEKSED
jgi:hypothetical protein